MPFCGLVLFQNYALVSKKLHDRKFSRTKYWTLEGVTIHVNNNVL